MSPNRLEKNLEILDKLYYYLKENPTIRFGQALINLNLATHRREVTQEVLGSGSWTHGDYDIFFEEPEQTLSKMRNL